jgi:hypothetical protein
MRIHVTAAAVLLSLGGLAAACTVSTTTKDNNIGAGDDTAPPSDDAGTLDAESDSTANTDSGALDASADAAQPEAFVRAAQWSPDAPPVDICFNPAGGSFSDQVPALGHVLANLAGDAGALDAGGGDGGAAPGLLFPQVTSYLIIPAGTYDVRFVAAGATDCTTGMGMDLTGVVLGASSYTTIAALGDVTPATGDQTFRLASFSDDVVAPSSQISLRFINASPAADLAMADLGTGSIVGNGGPFTAVFSAIAFGTASGAVFTDAGPVDANGYIADLPLAGATLSAHATGAAQDTTIASDDVSVASGAATVALINGSSNPTASSAAKLLLCLDQDDSAQNTTVFAQCSVISTD